MHMLVLQAKFEEYLVRADSSFSAFIKKGSTDIDPVVRVRPCGDTLRVRGMYHCNLSAEYCQFKLHRWSPVYTPELGMR